MKKRTLAVAALVVVLALVFAGTAAAITYGEPDNGAHPYVGLIGFYSSTDHNADTWLWRCSGTLIHPRVVLTAGHCTFGAASARVWFEEDHSDYDPGPPEVPAGSGYPYTGGYTGTPRPHPEYADFAGFPNTHDIGVVILDEPVTGLGLGVLPDEGFLDILATQRGHQDRLFTLVGYGLNSIRPTYESLRTRYKATAMLVNLRSALTDGYNLHTSNNPSQANGRGGSCFGDSGGPVFYGDDSSHLVVGITSFGLNGNCKGADFAYRTDIDESLSFIGDVLVEVDSE